MGELKEGSGHAYIAEGKALELTSELEQCSNGGQRLGMARALFEQRIYGEPRRETDAER